MGRRVYQGRLAGDSGVRRGSPLFFLFLSSQKQNQSGDETPQSKALLECGVSSPLSFISEEKTKRRSSPQSRSPRAVPTCHERLLLTSPRVLLPEPLGVAQG